MKRLPKGFTKGLKKVTGDFLYGIWDGMSPGYKKSTKSTKRRSKK